MRHVTEMLQEGVLYDYVQGELWLIAARIGRPAELQELLPTAKGRGAHKSLSFSIRRGLLAFFMSCRSAGVYAESRALKRFRAETPFIQSLVVPHLADADFRPNGIVIDLIQEPAYLPGMILAAHLVQRALSMTGLGVKLDLLAPQVRNVFQGLGLIAGHKKTIFDQIGDIA